MLAACFFCDVLMIFLSAFLRFYFDRPNDSRLIWNLRLDQFRQQGERFLPAEVTSFGRNDSGYAFLHNVNFSSARNFLQRDRGLYLAGHVRIVELVGVMNALVRLQFEIRSAEGMALAG